jgi:hypothetical protein
MALNTVSSDRLSTNVKNTNFTAAEKQDLTDDILPLAGQLGNRNLIINGAMQVAQRGTSFTSVTASAYHLDRFQYNLNGTVGAATVTQNTVTDLAGFTKSLKVDCTTADASLAASDRLTLRYGLLNYLIMIIPDIVQNQSP